MSRTSLKVGDLARHTGVSVRTLHHYEEIGLLSPAGRSSAGHRLYGEAEVVRLQQILSLRHLGFSLEEIRRCLDEEQVSLVRILGQHIAALTESIAREQRLKRKLEALVTRLRSTGAVRASILIETIRETVMFEKYYTPEQLADLQKRKKMVGEQRIAEVQAEWQELFDEFSKARSRGEDPGCEHCLELARKARSLIAEFTGGDAGIENSLRNLYRGEGGSRVLDQKGMDVEPDAQRQMSESMKALRALDE